MRVFCLLLLIVALHIQNGYAIEAAPPLFKDPELKTFGDEVEIGGIASLFQGTGPFTAFVPNNEAFKKFGADKLKELEKPENNEKLTDLLLYHIVPGKYMEKSLRTMQLRTVSGKMLEVTKDGEGGFKVNNAKVIKTDLVGPNGVIHIVDTVLSP